MGAPLKNSTETGSGKFSTELRDTTIYLIVASKTSDTLKAAITEHLNKVVGAVSVDETAVSKAVNVTGTQVPVARVDKPRVTVTVAADEMKAAVCLDGNSYYMNISKEDIVNELTKQGIVFGVKDDAVKEAVASPGKQFVVAQGKEAVNGKDSEIIFKNKVSEDDKGRPKEIGSGRVDYKDLNLFSGVMENEIIAERIPAVRGEDGVSIKGKAIKAVQGKDKKIKTGKNIIIEDNLIISKIAGHLVASHDKIEVLPVLELNGDIDLSTGNINFPGNVSVKGNVQAGFFVKAQGNVMIGGSVFGGTVEGKAVEVRYGIQSVGDSYVKAEEGKVSAKFVENAVIYAATDVIVVDTILHSRISAGRRVMVTGSKGLIAGGYITAGELVDSKNIGTQMAPPTIVEVGVNPVLKEEYVKLKDEYKEAVAKQDSIKKSLLLIKPNENVEVPEGRQEIYMKLTRANFALLGSISESQERLTFLESEFDKISDGRIRCSGYVFPGVKLIINNIVYPVRDVLQFAAFMVDGGEIRFSNYK